MKIISGILTPTEGKVTLGGKIVPMLELGSGFDFDLTGRENIFLNGSILGYSEEFLKERYDEIVEFSELGDFIEYFTIASTTGIIAFILGVLVSFIVGILVIKFLLEYLKKGSFKVFAIYRVIFGIIILGIYFWR